MQQVQQSFSRPRRMMTLPLWVIAVWFLVIVCVYVFQLLKGGPELVVLLKGLAHELFGNLFLISCGFTLLGGIWYLIKTKMSRLSGVQSTISGSEQ